MLLFQQMNQNMTYYHETDKKELYMKKIWVGTEFQQ